MLLPEGNPLARRAYAVPVRFWRLLFWAAVVFTLVMALIPPPQLPLNPPDKLQHMTAFAVLTALGAAAYRPTPWLRLFGGLIVFGAAIELLQGLPFIHRDSDPVDWLADTVATSIVLLAIWWWRARRGGSRQSR